MSLDVNSQYLFQNTQFQQFVDFGMILNPSDQDLVDARQ